jgi:NLI interacting factor-like phosphatase
MLSCPSCRQPRLWSSSSNRTRLQVHLRNRGWLNSKTGFFEIVYSRNHCRPDHNWKQRPGGRFFDTVKPLALHSLDLARTIIIDDTARKILPEEATNALLVPPFFAASDPGFVEETDDCIAGEQRRQRYRRTPGPVKPPGGETPATAAAKPPHPHLPVLRAVCSLLLHHIAAADGRVASGSDNSSDTHHPGADAAQGRRELREVGAQSSLEEGSSGEAGEEEDDSAAAPCMHRAPHATPPAPALDVRTCLAAVREDLAEVRCRLAGVASGVASVAERRSGARPGKGCACG